MIPLLTNECLHCLADSAESADRSLQWPDRSWDALRQTGTLRWSIPPEFGGSGLTATEQFLGSELLASACLTTAFILSQRETAVRQLLKGPQHLQERFLPRLASSELFATVGVSQLTTSRQHGGPALKAIPVDDARVQLDGEIPWVTGADQADIVVVGATLPNSLQLLLVLPTDREGVTLEPPMPLSALAGSRTSAIRCAGVNIETELLIAGPSERVLGPVGGGGLETSNLALGLAKGAIEDLRTESILRTDLCPLVVYFQAAIESARSRLHDLALRPDPAETLSLRVECTRLALRATQVALMAAKGSGFVSPHPAQRRARQSQFFLVWSCPRPVATGLLDDLLDTPE